MNVGINSRLIIHEILKLIRLKSINFDEAFEKAMENSVINQQNKNFIYNVVLTTLRNKILISKIISKLIKKIDKNSGSYFLLMSAICQIMYMNSQSHGIVNSTVEISKIKKFKTSPAFINACLRNLIRNKEIYINLKV